MTQNKTGPGVLRSMFHSLQGPLASAWHRCLLAGVREIEEMRSRPGPRCPDCGGQLILRKVGFGRDAGKQFWDCSNVPKCCRSIAAEEMMWPEASAATAAPMAAAA
jgi:hypothetical protein